VLGSQDRASEPAEGREYRGGDRLADTRAYRVGVLGGVGLGVSSNLEV